MATAAAIVHEIETSYAAYAAAFHRDDIAGIARYVAAPYVMIVAGNAPTMIETPEKVHQNFATSVAGMKARGWVRSEFKIVRIWPLSDKHAYLLSDVVRYKADGSMLEKGRYCYTFRQTDGRWQICAVTDVQPPHPGPGDFPRT
jgi:ketosteroid isomerase-like protein